MSLEVSTGSQTTPSEPSFAVVVAVAIDVVVVVAVVLQRLAHICVQCCDQYRISIHTIIIGLCKGRPCSLKQKYFFIGDQVDFLL